MFLANSAVRLCIVYSETKRQIYEEPKKIPLPVWVKGNYRFQPITPIAHPIGVVPGQTGMMWSFAKNPPIPTKMDNFGYVLFRKRGCCAF